MSQVVPNSSAAKWLVGDRLSLVLHIGDGQLAYELADQGHDVTVVGDDVVEARHDEVAFVCSRGERLPFRSSSFEVVVAPELRDSPTTLAEYARVLAPGGLVSTLSRSYDDSIPWIRKLRSITGDKPTNNVPVDTFSVSELFEPAEVRKFSAWEELDHAALLQFAEATRHPSVPTARLDDVQRLWQEYGAHAGSLRLRHETECIRARVNKENLATEPEPPDTVLIDFT